MSISLTALEWALTSLRTIKITPNTITTQTVACLINQGGIAVGFAVEQPLKVQFGTRFWRWNVCFWFGGKTLVKGVGCDHYSSCSASK